MILSIGIPAGKRTDTAQGSCLWTRNPSSVAGDNGRTWRVVDHVVAEYGVYIGYLLSHPGLPNWMLSIFRAGRWAGSWSGISTCRSPGSESFDLLTCCVSSYSYRSRAYSCFGRQFGHEEILSSSVKKMSEFAITKYPVNLFSRMYFAIFL
jgi:hypothetical protein